MSGVVRELAAKMRNKTPSFRRNNSAKSTSENEITEHKPSDNIASANLSPMDNVTIDTPDDENDIVSTMKIQFDQQNEKPGSSMDQCNIIPSHQLSAKTNLEKSNASGNEPLYKDLPTALRTKSLQGCLDPLRLLNIETFEDLASFDPNTKEGEFWSSLSFIERKKLKKLVEHAKESTTNAPKANTNEEEEFADNILASEVDGYQSITTEEIKPKAPEIPERPHHSITGDATTSSRPSSLPANFSLPVSMKIPERPKRSDVQHALAGETVSGDPLVEDSEELVEGDSVKSLDEDVVKSPEKVVRKSSEKETKIEEATVDATSNEDAVDEQRKLLEKRYSGKETKLMNLLKHAEDDANEIEIQRQKLKDKQSQLKLLDDKVKEMEAAFKLALKDYHTCRKEETELAHFIQDKEAALGKEYKKVKVLYDEMENVEHQLNGKIEIQEDQQQLSDDENTSFPKAGEAEVLVQDDTPEDKPKPITKVKSYGAPQQFNFAKEAMGARLRSASKNTAQLPVAPPRPANHTVSLKPVTRSVSTESATQNIAKVNPFAELAKQRALRSSDSLSSEPVEKGDSPCGTFVLDLTAAKFGACKCGFTKAEHEANKEPKSPSAENPFKKMERKVSLKSTRGTSH